MQSPLRTASLSTLSPVNIQGGEDVEGKLYKFKKGGSMVLIGQASMHGSVMNAILSMWNNHIKEIEKNA